MDASVAFLGLMGEHEARRLLAHEDVNVPHLADSELAQSLRHVDVGILTADAAVESIDIYVALAEHLECPLVTADRRLRAPGPACEMLVIGA